jgi:hypothetical protein
MEIDVSIAQLGTKLDESFDGNVDTFASPDRVAQVNALLRGVAIAKELDRLKADGLAALTALLDRQDASTEDERKASLVRGFEFGSRLAHTLHDELSDTDGETKVAHLAYAIVKTLDGIGSGRAALAVLLDHPDTGVRASAAAYLVDLMPDRVVPILREIDQKEGGSSADFTAHWALLDWELKQKAKQNKLD